MKDQPKALRLATQLQAEGWHYSADELRRPHAENERLLAAMKQFAECDLNEDNCASLEVASKRIRSVACAAIAKATGETK